MDEREYRGHWWLPDQFDERVGGVANYSPANGPTVELFDSLVPTAEAMTNTVRHDRIHGLTTDGDAMVLLGCKMTNFSNKHTQTARVSTSEYVARYLLKGDFFYRNNISFDSVRIGFPLLEEWAELISPRPIHPPSEMPVIGSAGDKLGIEAEIPTQKEVWIDGDQIKLSSHVNRDFDVFRGGSVTGTMEFRIEPRRPAVPLSEYLDHIKTLRDFVAFAVNRPVNPRFVNGVLGEGRKKITVNVMYSFQETYDIPESLHPKSTLFQLPDIEGRFAEVLQNWYSMNDNLESVVNLYFAIQYSTGLYADNTFIMLMQAFESYHREKYGGKYESTEKYENMIADLQSFISGDLSHVYADPTSFKSTTLPCDVSELKNLNEQYDIDSDLVNKLTRGVLEHANEYSLRKRLKDVVSEYESLLNDLPHNIVDKQHKIIETRNHITHQTQDPGPIVATDSDLVKLNWGLEQFLAVCLMTELGIPEDHITERLKRKYSRSIPS
jgi:hypothetical protein